jgi:hypothetical protein
MPRPQRNSRPAISIVPIAAALAAAMGLSVFGCGGSSSLSGVGDLFPSGGLTGDSRIVAGLKQALEVGTERAVGQTSQVNGFLGNSAIRIGLPESLDTMGKGLRAIGFGAELDQLEVAMNRAAEEASGEATAVFWDAIGQMSFSDARGILDGGQTAATDYFERTTREPLSARFEPIVAARMQKVGVVQQYQGLVNRYAALPFADAPSLKIEDYVTNGALDGLFHVLGQEERKIRDDPGARTTALLKEVFR